MDLGNPSEEIPKFTESLSEQCIEVKENATERFAASIHSRVVTR